MQYIILIIILGVLLFFLIQYWQVIFGVVIIIAAIYFYYHSKRHKNTTTAATLENLRTSHGDNQLSNLLKQLMESEDLILHTTNPETFFSRYEFANQTALKIVGIVENKGIRLGNDDYNRVYSFAFPKSRKLTDVGNLILRIESKLKAEIATLKTESGKRNRILKYQQSLDSSSQLSPPQIIYIKNWSVKTIENGVSLLERFNLFLSSELSENESDFLNHFIKQVDISDLNSELLTLKRNSDDSLEVLYDNFPMGFVKLSGKVTWIQISDEDNQKRLKDETLEEYKRQSVKWITYIKVLLTINVLDDNDN